MRGQRGVGVGHVQRGDPPGADGQVALGRMDVLQVGRGDAQPGRHVDDGRHADLLLELDVVGVHRVPGRLGHVVDPALRRVGVRVAGGAGAAVPPVQRELLRAVARRRVELGVQPVAGLECRGKGERLERRPGLEHRLGRQRLLGLVGGGVGAEHPVHRHRQDVAGTRLDHHLGGRHRVVGRYHGVDRVLRRGLDLGLQCRLDDQSAFVDPPGALGLGRAQRRVGQQPGADEVAEEGRARRLARVPRRRGRGVDHRDRGGLRRVRLGRGDVAQGGHPVQHDVPAQLGGIGVVHRVVQGRALHQPGEQRGLGKRQFGDVDLEVVLGGGTHAVVAVAEVGDVQVTLEDLVLGDLVLQGDGVPGLLDLALERRAGGLLALLLGVRVLQQHVLDVLLGQRRGALLDVPGLAVAQRGPQDALHVHPAVAVEA